MRRGYPILALVASLAALLSACSSMSAIAPSPNYPTSSAAVAAPAVLMVAARYAPAPTMSALVVPDFIPGREVELIALAKAECTGRTFCSVAFWTDDANAPRRLKMSNTQASARVAQLVISSRTGLSRTLWNCRVVSAAVLGECL